MSVSHCRNCRGDHLSMILDLGLTPPSRRFLTAELATRSEPVRPLRLLRCSDCGLLQLEDAAGFEALECVAAEPAPAGDDLACRLITRFDLRPADVVLDIGAGRPLLSGAFQNHRLHALTVAADRLPRQPRGSARLVLLRDALAGAADPHALWDAVDQVLSDDGVVLLEMPDLRALHERLAYDLVCHEARSYFSLAQFDEFLARRAFEAIDVEAPANGAGTLRLAAQRRGGRQPRRAAVDVALGRERAAELDRPQAWADFAVLAEQSRDLLASELEEWLYRNRPVAAYSVGGRGMTTLAGCAAAALRLPCMIDECPSLHGLLTPGHRIPVVSPERLREVHFDALLFLAGPWEAPGEGPLHEFWQAGGRVLIPTPKPHYVEACPRPHLPDRAAGSRWGGAAVSGPAFSDFG